MAKPKGKKQPGWSCSNLFTNAKAKKENIHGTIKVFRYWLRYLNGLLGLSDEPHNYPSYEERNAELQKRIDALLDEQQILKLDFENAPEQTAYLDSEIAAALKKIGDIDESRTNTKAKMKRVGNLKERLSVLEEELKAEGFTKENFEQMMEDLE